MKRWHIVWVVSFCLLLLPGCYDQVNLEDVNMTLSVGLDLDDNGNLIVYAANPVYSKEAKKRVERFLVRADTIRESRGKLDAKASGLVLGGKFQVVLVSKSLVEQENWFPLLDLIYREAKQSVTPRMIVCDNPLQEIFDFEPQDKPRLSILLRKLVDTSNERNITVKTTMQDLHREIFERGVTPAITEIKKGKKDVAVIGTALMDHQGRYLTTIGLQESGLLNLLKHEQQGDLSFTVALPGHRDPKSVAKQDLSIAVSAVKYKVDTRYEQGKFRFDLTMKMAVGVTERMFWIDADREQQQLEADIGNELQKQVSALIGKFQKSKIDPIGLGLYARAYQYPAWKQVQDHWGDAFAKADVHVTTKVAIQNQGVTN